MPDRLVYLRSVPYSLRPFVHTLPSGEKIGPSVHRVADVVAASHLNHRRIVGATRTLCGRSTDGWPARVEARRACTSCARMEEANYMDAVQPPEPCTECGVMWDAAATSACPGCGITIEAVAERIHDRKETR